jgi:DNA gyrase/topoisomerase IV subunit A
LEDKIVGKDSIELISENYIDYSKYTSKTRSYSGIYDGLKESYRHLIYASKSYNKHLVKAPTIIGETMKYSAHGDSSVEGVLKSCGCPYGNFPLYDTHGNWGGRGFPAAAPRYIECKISRRAELMYLNFLDYADWIDGETGLKEPEYLPSLLPYSLLSGNTSIPVGMPVPNIPPLNCMQLIDFYIATLTNSEKHYPIPDVGECYIDLNRKEVENMSRLGKGKIWYRAKVVRESSNTLVLLSQTPKNGFSKAVDRCQSWIDNNQVEYYDESGISGDRHVFIIPDKSSVTLDQLEDKINRAMNCSLTYTFIFEDNGNAVYCGLDHVVSKSLGYLRTCIIRKFNSALSKCNQNYEVFKAIEDLRASDQFPSIIKMTTSELRSLIIGFGYSEDIAKQATSKAITYLTVSHKSEMDQTLEEITRLKKLIEDPTDYLVSLYEELKSELKSFYDSRKHSVLLSEANFSYKAKISDGQIEISDNDGIDFNSHVIMISEEGWLKPLSINNQVESKYSMTINDYKYDKIVSDMHKYLVVIYDNYVAAIETSKITGDKRLYKDWKDSRGLIACTSTDNDSILLKTESGSTISININSFIKSRVGYPTKVETSENIVGFGDNA